MKKSPHRYLTHRVGPCDIFTHESPQVSVEPSYNVTITANVHTVYVLALHTSEHQLNDLAPLGRETWAQTRTRTHKNVHRSCERYEHAHGLGTHCTSLMKFGVVVCLHEDDGCGWSKERPVDHRRRESALQMFALMRAPSNKSRIRTRLAPPISREIPGRKNKKLVLGLGSQKGTSLSQKKAVRKCGRHLYNEQR